MLRTIDRSADWLRHQVAVHRRELAAAAHDPALQPPLDEQVVIRDQVRAALGVLSEAERDPILLAYFGGLTYREVAQKLGIPDGTAKSRIRSGLLRLAVMLEGQAPGNLLDIASGRDPVLGQPAVAQS